MTAGLAHCVGSSGCQTLKPQVPQEGQLLLQAGQRLSHRSSVLAEVSNVGGSSIVVNEG